MGAEVPEDIIDDLSEFGGLDTIKRMRPDPSVLARLEGVYSILSCRRRIEVVYFLNFSRMTPGLLSELTGMPPNLLSFHLRKLTETGVVESKREGRFRVYSLTMVGESLSGPLAGPSSYNKA